MHDLDQLLIRLGSTSVEHRLDELEADVWRGVSAHEARRRRAASIRPVGAAGVLGAIVLGVVAGGSVPQSSRATEFEVFSPHAALAPSTLLGTPG